MKFIKTFISTTILTLSVSTFSYTNQTQVTYEKQFRVLAKQCDLLRSYSGDPEQKEFIASMYIDQQKSLIKTVVALYLKDGKLSKNEMRNIEIYQNDIDSKLSVENCL